MPAQWKNSETVAAALQSSNENWWQDFNDPALNAAVEQALAHNNNLALAALKVQHARLETDRANNARWPTPTTGFNSTASRNVSRSESISRRYEANIGIRYQLDLWGKLAHEQAANEWEAQATEQDKQSARLSLISTTATLYWKLAYLQERIAISNSSIEYAAQTLKLVNAQQRAGAVGQLEVMSAQRQLANQQAEHTQLLQALSETRNAYAILFDQPPENITGQEPQQLPDKPLPAIAPDLPASLLGRRPDLHATELRLRATLAEGDAVRASYYPDFTLTSSVAYASDALGSVLKNPAAVLGIGTGLPFLNVREMNIHRALTANEYEQAVTAFRQTLYEALGEVESSLSAHTHYSEQATQLGIALAAARNVERIYEKRYRAGNVSLSDWLDAQQARRQAEAALLENHYNRLLNFVDINLALGGSTINSGTARSMQ
jgi:NodT family efflux transporter outer membrane factor (OMF) lipoprotein